MNTFSSTHVIFNEYSKVTGDSSHLFGDGFALWITKDRAQPGPVFGSIGALPRTRSCLVGSNKPSQTNLRGWVYSLTRMYCSFSYLSTSSRKTYRYANGRHAYSFPRIVAMMGDGKTSYDHDDDGDKNSMAACSVG